MHILYLNAYEVTRHYGGPEEGGWWWNLFTPLASVPIPAKELPGCAPHECSQCDAARENQTDDYCRCLPENWETEFDHAQKEHARDFDLGYETHPELSMAVWEKKFPKSSHLVPEYSDEKLEERENELTAMFIDGRDDNIYSVNGGSELAIRLENHVAEIEPKTRPHYE
jgi:hypothetical protein